MLLWAAIILGAQCLSLGLLGWFLSRRNELAIQGALRGVLPERCQSLDCEHTCNVLATASDALSHHSEDLSCFERSLQADDGGRPDYSSVSKMKQANQCVERALDTTIEDLAAACGELLSEEQSSLEGYRDQNSALASTLEGIKDEDLLVKFADTLLGMVRELRAENNSIQQELTASKDKIIQLLTRASSAEQIARVDTLTQLPNRRAFDEAHAQCKELQDQSGQPYSLILLDIDHFKSVNDEYGHAAGDALLSLLARILREKSKTSDHPCRLGGDEFAVLLPRCGEGPAKSVADCYRRSIESSKLLHGSHKISITISCGVAQAIPGNSQSDLLERADAALYVAKTRGRNQTYADGCLDETQDVVLA